MINPFLAFVRRLLGSPAQTSAIYPVEPNTNSVQAGLAEDAKPAAGLSTEAVDGSLVPFDEDLLERSKTQWQFGDWESLAEIDRTTLQHHPDRAKLALLAAAGHQQLGDREQARRFTELARDWGCSPRLVSQILISGVHQSLANASLLGAQDRVRTARHLHQSLAQGDPRSDIRLISQARWSGMRRRIRSLQPIDRELLAALGAQDTPELLQETTHDSRIHTAVETALRSEDMHAAVETFLNRHIVSHRLEFLTLLADRLAERGDRLSACHFLQLPFELGWQLSRSGRAMVIQKLVALGQEKVASKWAFQGYLSDQAAQDLDADSKRRLDSMFNSVFEQATKTQQHGHDLLLDHLKAMSDTALYQDGASKRVLVEVGSTRELAPGQGSTAALAAFCKAKGIHFITVDMDPQNTRFAQQVFNRLGVSFDAVTRKGEDFLSDYQGLLDYIFLDAYDFDHGNHSELRQSRYEQFLGERINDAQCHEMHLLCAKAVSEKLSPSGLICFDDTWLENGQWVAKGTTAMPYLLEQGFELVEAKNRAAILRRVARDTA